MAGSAKTIQTNRGGMADAELREIFAKTRSAKKFQIRFFYPAIVGCSPVEESRPSGKLNCQRRGRKRLYGIVGSTSRLLKNVRSASTSSARECLIISSTGPFALRLSKGER
jgi:hypothetical protein